MVTVNKCLTALALAFAVTAFASPSFAQAAGYKISAARAAATRKCSVLAFKSAKQYNSSTFPMCISIQLAWPNTAKDHERFLQITDTAPGITPPRGTCLLFLETPTAGPRGDYCASGPHIRG